MIWQLPLPCEWQASYVLVKELGMIWYGDMSRENWQPLTMVHDIFCNDVKFGLGILCMQLQ